MSNMDDYLRYHGRVGKANFYQQVRDLGDRIGHDISELIIDRMYADLQIMISPEDWHFSTAYNVALNSN